MPPSVDVRPPSWFHVAATALSVLYVASFFAPMLVFYDPALGLPLAQFVFPPLLGFGVVVGIDAAALGVGRLKRSRLKLSDTERMGPWAWSLCAVALALIMVPWYWSIRGTLATYAAQTLAVGEFPDRAALRSAKKRSGHVPNGAVLPP